MKIKEKAFIGSVFSKKSGYFSISGFPFYFLVNFTGFDHAPKIFLPSTTR
jgi:hypothetical protein